MIILTLLVYLANLDFNLTKEIEMKKLTRTTLQIRKADVRIYSKIQQFNFSKFVSEMMHSHGQNWINEQLAQLQSLNSDNARNQS